MSAAVLVGDVVVLLFGVFMCVGPLVTRPSVQFGVRVPPGHARALVIRRERCAYQWRSVLIAIGALAALIALGGHVPRWPSRLILIIEVAADLGCFWRAHQQIAKVKSAEGRFAGRRETVVADTSWRSEPEAFPARWLLPAVAVIAATVTIGVLRYPHQPRTPRYRWPELTHPMLATTRTRPQGPQEKETDGVGNPQADPRRGRYGASTREVRRLGRRQECCIDRTARGGRGAHRSRTSHHSDSGR